MWREGVGGVSESGGGEDEVARRCEVKGEVRGRKGLQRRVEIGMK
jgi:hypothetical protein